MAGTAALGYDARGNLTSSGSDIYGYSQRNLLHSAPGVSLAYDPRGRLDRIESGAGARGSLMTATARSPNTATRAGR